jgi:hypothetical protein
MSRKDVLLHVTNWIEADAILNDPLRAMIGAQNKHRIELNS